MLVLFSTTVNSHLVVLLLFVTLEMIDQKRILSTVLLKKMCGKGPRNLILKFEGPEFCSTTTNCSRTPLIAKWYLGGPLTNSRMTKWSMDDMSLGWL